MQENTSSLVVATLIEIVSDASGIPVSLIQPHHQLDADLGLSISQIEDLRYAAEFEFGIEINPDEWLQHADSIESMEPLLEEPNSTPRTALRMNSNEGLNQRAA
jgi:hypothetical protein